MRLNFRPAEGASCTVFCRHGVLNRRVYFQLSLALEGIDALAVGRVFGRGQSEPRQKQALGPSAYKARVAAIMKSKKANLKAGKFAGDFRRVCKEVIRKKGARVK